MSLLSVFQAAGMIGRADWLRKHGRDGEAFDQLLRTYALVRSEFLSPQRHLTRAMLSTAALIARQLNDRVAPPGQQAHAVEVLQEVHARVAAEIGRTPGLNSPSVGDWIKWADERLRQLEAVG